MAFYGLAIATYLTIIADVIIVTDFAIIVVWTTIHHKFLPNPKTSLQLFATYMYLLLLFDDFISYFPLLSESH